MASNTAPIDIPGQGDLVERNKCPGFVIYSHSILNADFTFDLHKYAKLPRTDRPTVFAQNSDSDWVKIPVHQKPKVTRGFRCYNSEDDCVKLPVHQE